jgi:transposase
MSKTTGSSPRDWREARRLRAWELRQQGWSQRAIARALGVSEGAVSQWMSRARTGGVLALRRRLPPGATPKLTHEQRAELPAVLAKGAEHYGFIGEVWTGRRVAAVIQRVYGVRYHRAHASRLLRQIGWSSQKPIRRASQRDEAAIQRWLTERWPLIKKGPSRKAARSCG